MVWLQDLALRHKGCDERRLQLWLNFCKSISSPEVWWSHDESWEYAMGKMYRGWISIFGQNDNDRKCLLQLLWSSSSSQLANGGAAPLVWPWCVPIITFEEEEKNNIFECKILLVNEPIQKFPEDMLFDPDVFQSSPLKKRRRRRRRRNFYVNADHDDESFFIKVGMLIANLCTRLLIVRQILPVYVILCNPRTNTEKHPQ